MTDVATSAPEEIAVENRQLFPRDEAEFAAEVLAFLECHAKRRGPEALAWGEGDERLALFHETSGQEFSPPRSRDVTRRGTAFARGAW